MIKRGFGLVGTLAAIGGEAMLDATSLVVDPGDCMTISPRSFRRLFLTFEESIQGKIPEILGEDEGERLETLVRLLRGTSPEDMNKLLSSFQGALVRLAQEERGGPTRSRPASRKTSCDRSSGGRRLQGVI